MLLIVIYCYVIAWENQGQNISKIHSYCTKYECDLLVYCKRDILSLFDCATSNMLQPIYALISFGFRLDYVTSHVCYGLVLS